MTFWIGQSLFSKRIAQSRFDYIIHGNGRDKDDRAHDDNNNRVFDGLRGVRNIRKAFRHPYRTSHIRS